MNKCKCGHKYESHNEEEGCTILDFIPYWETESGKRELGTCTCEKYDEYTDEQRKADLELLMSCMV